MFINVVELNGYKFNSDLESDCLASKCTFPFTLSKLFLCISFFIGEMMIKIIWTS